jgi:hypothetical protein
MRAAAVFPYLEDNVSPERRVPDSLGKKRIRAAMADIRSIGTILRTTEHLETNQRADVSQSWLRQPWALTLRGNLRSGLSGKGRAMFPRPPTAPTAAVLGPWTTPPPCASSLLLLR